MIEARTSSRIRQCLIAVVTCFICFTSAWAHDSGPPPPPPSPIKIDDLDPLDWTWLHWWEANRDRYIWPDRLQGGGAFQDVTKSRKAARDKTVAALIKATQTDVPHLRASAAIALGRIGQSKAVKPVASLLTDKDPSVRWAAWLGLGLLDTPGAREQIFTKLSKYGRRPQTEQLATIAALGLLRSPNARAKAVLHRLVRGSDRSAARMAAWGLRRYADSESRSVMLSRMQVSDDAWLAGDAILSQGYSANPKAAAFLADVVQAGSQVNRIDAWVALEDQRNQINRIRSAASAAAQLNLYKKYRKQLENWRQQSPNKYSEIRKQDDDVLNLKFPHVQVGIVTLYQARLRGSAAIAAGHFEHPLSRRGLFKVIKAHKDEKRNHFRDLAIISLGKIGDQQTLAEVVELFNTSKSQTLHGFAALAIGLHVRGADTRQETDFAGIPKRACELLAERFANRNEHAQVRAACVLALGLTQHQRSLELLRNATDHILKKAGKKIGEDDELVLGYALLALGMYGEERIIVPALRMLMDTEDRLTEYGILARRAAVLGLGMVRHERAVKLIQRAWELNYYIAREAAVALSLSEDYRVADRLIQSMQLSKKHWGKAFSAEALGMLFTADRPPRTTWFVAGSNYTMRNDEMKPFVALGNEFLTNYMVGSFGDVWW